MLISIITPVKNGAQYLEEMLQSIHSQSYPFIEHIIVDGGSSDGSLEIIQNFEHKYPNRIRLVCGHDRGACDALNKGWQIARGEVLGWLGADDCYLPEAIKIVADFFTDNPNKHFLYGECEIINAAGDYVGRFATREFVLETALNNGLYVPFPSAFYRRQVIEKVGPVVVGHKACDSDFIIRASKCYKLCRIKSNLTQFRLHSTSISCTSGITDYPKAFFQLNREHGGRLLSPICLRYFKSILIKIPFVKSLYSLLTPWNYQPQSSSSSQKYAIFGASLSGYQCLNNVLESGKYVDVFIDNFPPCDSSYCGRPVFTPLEFMDKVADSVDAVLIASSSSAYAMWYQLRRMGFRKSLKIFRVKPYQ